MPNTLPEQRAREKIDKQLNNAGWEIVSRNDYIPNDAMAVKEALMQGNTESDYLLFVENKAIAVVEAKRKENDLDEVVADQAENYALSPQSWYGLWENGFIPLVYLANGEKIYFRNLLEPDSEYAEIKTMHSPKKMLQLINKHSNYGALPRIDKEGLRDCQYDAEVSLESSIKNGNKKSLAVLATGSGKTYLACLASYRLLNYTSINRVLFLVDRNNLGKQAETEFSLFDRTESRNSLSSIYEIKRLKKEDDIKANIVISTIQKLYAVLTGAQIPSDISEDEEDETNEENKDKDKTIIELGDDLKLPKDYFQFIVVDECHRSIYGKWKAVLDYFDDAIILGLTATPTPEAHAFFNKNIVENYTYDDSVVDGVNVPSRIYRIKTNVSVHGGTIDQGSTVIETSRKNNQQSETTTEEQVDYDANELDKTIVNPSQIKTVLKTYRDSIYEDLYPDREENWEYIPKTLIFAKTDSHADQIVDACKDVFKEKFPNNKIPENYVQKITYSAGDSNSLIRDFRNKKDFRIAVTVTLVATGTDIRPLECVLFMKDVNSDVLYTQMKGRGCRTISDDKLKEITPNAETKECYYIIDAVGVTEHEHIIPTISNECHTKKLSLEVLIEHLSHNEVSNENLILLRDYCSRINSRLEHNQLFRKHLDSFIHDYGFAPKTLANNINYALTRNTLPEYDSPSDDNTIRKNLISCLINDINARNKLLEMHKGYYVFTTKDDDIEIYSGFSKESARDFINNFEKCLEDNKDQVEALRIIYNSEDKVITFSMLNELYGMLLRKNKEYKPSIIWNYYKVLDNSGNIDELNKKYNVNALTNLIQIARYAYKKTGKLTSLQSGFLQRFNLFCGRSQRVLSQEQKEIMEEIARYIVEQGAITSDELNSFDTDLWRKAIRSFGVEDFKIELNILPKFILRTA